MTYNEIKSLLNNITDPADKLEMVMDIGREAKHLPPGVTGTVIPGCVWRVEIYRDKEGVFYGFADSLLVRGIVAILFSMVDGKSAAEIKKIDLEGEFASLQLQLGSKRLSGVASIIGFLKSL